MGEVEEIFYLPPLPKKISLFTFLSELETAHQLCFFLSINSSFGYSEKLSDIKLDAIKVFIIFNNCIAQKDSELGFLPSVSLMLLFLCKQSPPFKISHVLYFFCFIMIKMHIYTIT